MLGGADQPAAHAAAAGAPPAHAGWQAGAPDRRLQAGGGGRASGRLPSPHAAPPPGGIGWGGVDATARQPSPLGMIGWGGGAFCTGAAARHHTHTHTLPSH